NARQIADWSKSLGTVVLPQPPAWLAGVPAIGSRLAERWQHLAAASPEEVSARLSPFARGIVLWFVGQVGSLGLLLVQFLLTVIVVAILYSNGETVAQAADRFARRLAGTQGENAVHLAARAIRAVALGVIGGLIAFGVIGLFIGPVVLAVAYTLLVDWVSEGGPHERQAPPLSVR